MADATTVNKRLEAAVPLEGGRLKLWPRNYNRGDVDAIAESIRINGFFGTIVAQESTGYILAGNHTFQAAKQAGLESVAVAWVDVSDEDASRIALADNLTARRSTFDDRQLAELLQELHATERGLLGTGSSEDEYLDLLAELDSEIDLPGLTDDDDAPDLPEKAQTVSLPGDIWLIGDHRVGCGSSLDPEHVGRLFAGRRARLVVTDPPYNVAYEGKTKDRLTIANDAMTPEEFQQFMFQAMKTTTDFMEPGACIYVAYAETEVVSFRQSLDRNGVKYSQTLVWVKDSGVLSRQDYNWRHEPVLYGWKEGAGHYFNGDFSQTTVLDFSTDLASLSKQELLDAVTALRDGSSVIYLKKPNRNDVHPTMKPVALFQKFIHSSSRPTELVYDPFGGSGTTLIASHKKRRACITNDLDPRYADVIVQRAQEFTGLTATLEGDGRSFAEIRAERTNP